MKYSWQRLSFSGQLFITASIALLMAGGVTIAVVARHAAADARNELKYILAQELETLPTTLTELIVIGDFATLQQTLNRYIMRPLIIEARYTDISGTSIISRDSLEQATSPLWFRNLFDYHNLHGSIDITVGGRKYGQIALVISPQQIVNRTWQQLIEYFFFQLLAILLNFLGIWLVLYFGLLPLKQLEVATKNIADGNLDTRLDVIGNPELRRLLNRFNQMAEAIQSKESALRESEERLRLAIAGSNDGIWDWDINNNKVYFSPRWKQMIGYEDHELTGDFATFERLLHPDDRPRILDFIKVYLSGAVSIFVVEFRFQHKNGSWRWILGRGEALRDANGRPYRMAGSHTDITDRKNFEEALIEAKVAAESSTRAKSRFLATMSHEIRTPMNGILGMAQLLLMHGLNEEERYEYVHTILNSGQTLLTLLNDILDLSKVEAGKLDLVYNAFNPAQIIKESAALFAESIRIKKLTITTAWLGPADRMYRSDSIRLRQMLNNLINNAIKFTNHGYIYLEASQIKLKENIVILEFAVTDTGIGIAADKIHLLFQPFSQIDSSTTRAYNGSGLGLSIVRSFAQLMGGDIGVESQVGKGSRFWFRIQAEILPEQHNNSNIIIDQAAGQKIVTTETLTKHILVVEDNLINRSIIEALLKKFGFMSESVENGQQAVEAITLRRFQPDIVLMDIQMPVMDGLEATRHIRKWEQDNSRPHLPIIALTAGVFAEDRQLCTASGMDDFLAKPINFDELTAILSKYTHLDNQVNINI